MSHDSGVRLCGVNLSFSFIWAEVWGKGLFGFFLFRGFVVELGGAFCFGFCCCFWGVLCVLVFWRGEVWGKEVVLSCFVLWVLLLSWGVLCACRLKGCFWGSFGGCFVFCRFEGLNLSRGLRNGVKV